MSGDDYAMNDVTSIIVTGKLTTQAIQGKDRRSDIFMTKTVCLTTV